MNKALLRIIVSLVFMMPITQVAQILPTIQDPSILDLTDEELNGLSEEMINQEFEYVKSLNINNIEQIPNLQELGWMTAQQQQALQAYIEKYGPLLSVFELLHINGFSYNWLINNDIVLECGPVERMRKTSSNVKLDQEMRTRYHQEEFLSRMVSRLSLDFDHHLRANIVVEKDRGEPLLRKTGGLGPEHLSGNITWRGKGVLRQCIVGDHRVEGGYGLAFGKGFGSFDSRFPGGEAYAPLRIRPKATSMESYASSGFAVSFALRSLSLSFSSSVNRVDGRLIFENGGWRIVAPGYGDHSTFSMAVKRDQCLLERQVILGGWEGRWYKTGFSYTYANLSDPTAEREDSILSFQQSRSMMLGCFFQGRTPNFSLAFEGCSDWENTGWVLGITSLPSNWLSMKTIWSYQEGGWPLPAAHSGMAQWTGSRRMAHYLGAQASWGRGWSASIGQQFARELNLRYGIPVKEWELRYWLKLMQQTRQGSLGISATLRWNGPDDVKQELVVLSSRRAARIFWTHGVPSAQRYRVSVQLGQSGQLFKQSSWGLSFNIGSDGYWKHQSTSRYFIDFCLHDVDDAGARITAFMRDPAGGVRMSGLYHKGIRLNMGVEWKRQKNWAVVGGVVCEKAIQHSDQSDWKIEAVVRIKWSHLLNLHLDT